MSSHFQRDKVFEIFTDATQLIMRCTETRPSFFVGLMRMLRLRAWTPYQISIATPSGENLLELKRPVNFFNAPVSVFAENLFIGRFRKFHTEQDDVCVLDEKDNVLVKINYPSWTADQGRREYIFLSTKDEELGILEANDPGDFQTFKAKKHNIYRLEIMEHELITYSLRQLMIASVIFIEFDL